MFDCRGTTFLVVSLLGVAVCDESLLEGVPPLLLEGGGGIAGITGILVLLGSPGGLAPP